MGALDNDTNETSEIREVPAADARWIEGTSRDLFGPESLDDASSSSENLEPPEVSDTPSAQLSSDEHSNEIVDGMRNDGRDEALRDYRLDAESEALAHQVGRDIAEVIPRAGWLEADVSTRARMCDDAFLAFGSDLAPGSAAPMPEHGLNPNDLGWSQKGEVHYNADLLNDESPQRAIETLVHEYRHVWQEDVMAGRQEHPLGEPGLDDLVEGTASYEADDLLYDSYATNPLELDAEKFARHAFAAYSWKSSREASQ